MLDYRIVEKAPFTIVGVKRPFNSETSYQETNTKIWSEWLPALKGYSLLGEYDIEVYLPPEEGSDEMSVYIWVPLKKD